ncbi:MAG: DUF1269 domain-containing protein [Microlunatus sp.]|nr:DUF1269 domain-containing protein [Microlunatus sp.]MDN5769660.1 DUF1269 domain-containing protein [Microlunatus sp.]
MKHGTDHDGTVAKTRKAEFFVLARQADRLPSSTQAAPVPRTANPTSPRKATMSTELDEAGPIDYLVVEFPGNKMTGEGLPLLVDLVDSGIIRILDLIFVKRETDGSVAAMEIADFDGDGTLDLAVFEGASSGLLGQDDIDEATSAVEPGSAAGILVYENTWAAPFAAALRRSGAQLVASGRIPTQAILAALDDAEAKAEAESETNTVV